MLFSKLVTRLYALRNFNVNHVAARAVGAFRLAGDLAGIDAKSGDECLQADFRGLICPLKPHSFRLADQTDKNLCDSPLILDCPRAVMGR